MAWLAVSPKDTRRPSARSCEERILRLRAWFTTTKTCCPRVLGGSKTIERDINVTGISTWNEDPAPSVLSAMIAPPIASTRRLVIDRPKPLPPKRRDVDSSACVKGGYRGDFWA